MWCSTLEPPLFECFASSTLAACPSRYCSSLFLSSWSRLVSCSKREMAYLSLRISGYNKPEKPLLYRCQAIQLLWNCWYLLLADQPSFLLLLKQQGWRLGAKVYLAMTGHPEFQSHSSCLVLGEGRCHKFRQFPTLKLVCLVVKAHKFQQKPNSFALRLLLF